MSDHLMTEPDDNELNRFWNDLIQGTRDQRGYAVPDEDRQTLTTFQTRGTSIQPGPARERAWQETLTRIDVNQPHKEYRMNSLAIEPSEPMRLAVNGHAVSPPRRPSLPVPFDPAKSRLWPLVSLAAAAVLLIAAVSGYFLFGSDGSEDEPQSIIPAAIFSEATPSPIGQDEELLLQITLPADVVPTGDTILAGLARFAVPAGNSSVWTPPCCPGPLIEYVVRGSYTVRAEEPVQVIRGDGSMEDVPAGTEVTLKPGDSLLSDNETIVEASNFGNEPVQLLGWVLIDDRGFNGHILNGWQAGWPDATSVGIDPPAPALVRLIRITLLPDEVWTPSPGALVLQTSLPVNDEGTPIGRPSIGKNAEGVINNAGSTAATIYVMTLEPAEPGSGTPTA